MSCGINSIHQKLRAELENYIKAQYFGKSPLLLKAVGDLLDAEGLLYREPFIEASAAYKTLPRGFETIALPAWLKKFFLTLGNAGLGVYLTPFVHQIQALEAATRGRDLFVSTGTGSGKTECFMFPMLAKLAAEAHDTPSTWAQRGVRVMVMYPMNALVSDQISRLRRLIGNQKFVEIFRDACGSTGRRPQFGMYTGRTPYPGEKSDRAQDKQLASTLRSIMLSTDEKFFNRLLAEGKIPSKENPQQFLEALERGEHLTDPEDAELITRFEMQRHCPDILITNYSMLEYMLMRPREQGMWQSTREWLESAPSNKLLFVIDEAHMYKGSAGGEVALLIRRLLYKLKINRDKVQFILTTASMPPDQSAVQKFFRDLTGSEGDFEYLTGEREILSVDQKYDIDEKTFLQCKAEEFEGDEQSRLKALNDFWSTVEGAPQKFSSLQNASAWLFDHLLEYRPFAKMIGMCRGAAISVKELATNIFPALSSTDALNALNVLLSMAPLARNVEGAVLFPARMHMLFRGLKGVYACTNPKCPHSHVENTAYGALQLGEIFFSDGDLNCPHCGGAVYELYNDRRCGALFFKGYTLEGGDDGSDKKYLWRYSGQMLDERLREMHLFIPPDGYEPDAKQKRGAHPLKPCWLDVQSGFIYFVDERREGTRKLYYSEFEDGGRLTFYECPHCRHQLSQTQLTSFNTRGNQSFYNLIKTQFQNQPAVPGKSDLPNEGRKVLLFSDSRQRAATLARDMSRISDDNAARQLFAVAADEMERGDYSMNALYDYFCLAAGQRGVQLFNGSEHENFAADCKEELNRFNKAKKRGREFSPKWSIDRAADQFEAVILRLFCGGYNTLYDSAISWLEPDVESLYNAIDKLADYNIDVSNGEFLELFNAWIMSVCDQNTALGYNISDLVRQQVRKNYGGYGLTDRWKFSTVICDIMGWDKNSTAMMNWRRVLQDNFLRRNEGNFYVDLNTLRARFDLNHRWHRCDKCKELTPYLLKGRCPTCGSDATHVLTDGDLEALRFWRQPLEEAVEGAAIRVMDTEEHTAQLSHKDQRDEFWSKTEGYELRFQDFLREGEAPVDILSSTTTMEVGIDIGSLVAIGLRNIPPMRENYQQRAGRAGRRGSSLSTIVTFCEDGPHDTLYFNDPVPMFRGDPRKPWIDVESEKLFHRHLSIILFEEFLSRRYSSLDTMAAADFLTNYLDEFKRFALDFKIPRGTALLPKNISVDNKILCDELFDGLNELNAKKERHPELFGVLESGALGRNAKDLLDALYEEGLIPTYSFPKDVVSTYVVDGDGKIVYQVTRGLDVAISECAPGRALVVDKQTYQIGGIYHYDNRYSKVPARKFVEDQNYVKELMTCKCGWFGLASENHSSCPFCGNRQLRTAERKMLRPWGFAPKNATAIAEAQLTEEYSMAQPPEYSTLPERDEMSAIPNCKHIRMASRDNQRIIMLNKGAENSGFKVCCDCGAAMPNTKKEPLKGVGRPYKTKYANCRHANTIDVDLGFDFVTDMLVLEIELDGRRVDTRDGVENLWLDRAAQSVAEAFRLSACKELDIEFGELVTGYRIRRTDSQRTFVDVYIYDNLSSGAGYSIRIASEIESLLERMRDLLKACRCATACSNCLKHYRNQHVHGRLDRYYGLQLLDWGMDGRIATSIPFKVQKKYAATLENILAAQKRSLRAESDKIYVVDGGDKIELEIYPAMWAVPQSSDKIYICDSYFKYARPYALAELLGR